MPVRKALRLQALSGPVRGLADFRALIFLLAIIGTVIVPARSVSALELGMTPSQVYGLWTNINSAIVAHVAGLSIDDAWKSRVTAMQAHTFKGKRPKDVLEQVQVFSERLTAVGGVEAPDADGANFEREIAFQFRQEKSFATPSKVFLRSARVLVRLTRLIVSEASTEHVMSYFFVDHGFTGKTPDDVYALVDLALRRIELISSVEASKRASVPKVSR